MTQSRRRIYRRWFAYFVWAFDGKWREQGLVWAFNHTDAIDRTINSINDERRANGMNPLILDLLKWRARKMQMFAATGHSFDVAEWLRRNRVTIHNGATKHPRG